MGRTHLTFRFSSETLTVIAAHQRELSVVKGREVDRTEATEDIILNFPKRPVLQGIFHSFRRKKPAPDPQTKPLEVFTSAKET